MVSQYVGMSKSYYFKHSGLLFESNIDLPEWRNFQTASADNTHCVKIEVSQSEPVSSGAEAKLPIVTPSSYEFYVPEVASFHVTRDRIHVQTSNQPNHALIRAYILGSCLAALYYLNGMMCLHASIVRFQGWTLAFCGQSGQGKSTLAAALIKEGGELITDDLCRVYVEADKAFCCTSNSRMKLWKDSISHLQWQSRPMLQDLHRHEKYHFSVNSDIDSVAVPIDAIYILVWGEMNIRRLTGLDALRRLVSEGTYRGDMLEPMGQLASVWAQTGSLLRTVPLYELSRIKDFETLDDVIMKIINSHPFRAISNNDL